VKTRWSHTYNRVKELARDRGIFVDFDNPISKYAWRMAEQGTESDAAFMDFLSELVSHDVISKEQMYTFTIAYTQDRLAQNLKKFSKELNEITQRISNAKTVKEGVKVAQQEAQNLSDLTFFLETEIISKCYDSVVSNSQNIG
jgi:membrane-bound lytic murein transglycosylase B